MLIQKSYLKVIFVVVLVFLPVLTLTGRLFVGRGDVSRSADFFEMSLEELMTVEVSFVDEPDVNRSVDFL